MIAVFKRFFAFSSERKALWYRAFALEVLRTVAEALQFLPLAFILMNLVEGSLAQSADHLVAHSPTPVPVAPVAVSRAASSYWFAAQSSAASENFGPMSCIPTGMPSPPRPQGTLMPGRPAMLAGTVQMSVRYVSTGSFAA